MRKIEVDEDALIAYYREVRSPQKTADKFGLGVSTVERKLKRYGVERIGQRGLTRKLPETIKDEYLVDGMSMNQIARKYSVQLSTVAEALARAGVDSRARGGIRKQLTDEFRAECVRLYTERKMPQEEIAQLLKTSQTRVSRALMACGIYHGTRHRENHASWKGGRVHAGSGYVGIYLQPDDPMMPMVNTLGYALEHRVVMGRSIGRPLEKHETVHHINGNKTDNRLENLQLRSGHHGKGVVYRCRDCGSTNIESTRLN